MSVASKLTKSVRQAKESAANQHDETESDAVDMQSPQEKRTAAKPARKTATTRTSKRPESSVAPLPYRRVWPD